MTQPSPRPSGWTDAARLAVTTLTVVPLRAGLIDRRAAGRAMLLAPVVGVLLGAVVGGLAWGLRQVLPAVLAGALAVGANALLTRGLHLDGLADTVDALGAYRGRERALEIMKSPEVGPFGVAALVLVLLVQAVAVGSAPFPAVVAAWAAGRVAITLACARGVPAARPGGLGAFVAGSVPRPAAAAAALAVAALAIPAVAARWWQGPAAVLLALCVVLLLLRHLVRRLGGITGDVLGFVAETALTGALIGLTVA
ncbi:adenosylcobinamide-GDP ribazoletransferase [Hamadaea tsunoensis]|uniref:adenosylcobinamide-GDP ribazoletransferase n=1 Tax=Hamadaea tsunoensis TaxID=53368 RepID=UPI0003F921E8|nr:adenosylcobinamide-GDP ribazoletransferase [Hamadaea tsunoensis]